MLIRLLYSIGCFWSICVLFSTTNQPNFCQPTCCLTHLFEPRAGKKNGKDKVQIFTPVAYRCRRQVGGKSDCISVRPRIFPTPAPTFDQRCNVKRFACGAKFWTLAVIRKNRQIIGSWFGILIPEKTDCFVISFNGSSANQSQGNCGGFGLGRIFPGKKYGNFF